MRFGWLLAFWSICSFASLGGRVDTIESDRQAFAGQLGRISSPRGRSDVSIHELQKDGIKIREFTRSDGTVFAVTWHGAGQPDLSVLFGRFFREYQQALAARSRRNIQRRSRSSRVLRSQNLVIENSGHMRDVRGKAYLPELMPNDFHPKDIVE